MEMSGLERSAPRALTLSTASVFAHPPQKQEDYEVC